MAIWAVAAAAVLAIVSAGGAAPTPTLDQQVRAVASRLRCPVCQNESVADSPSELAAQMRGVIRERLARGESPESIIAYFVSRYGQWILLNPPRRGVGWLLWLAPAGVFAGGLVIAVRFIRKTAQDQP
jgi:cytochrome c-type biogenesis protein CcmH